MTLRFLLDTNIVSEPLRPAPDPIILAHLRRITSWQDMSTENHP
ncbi:MAG: hypothetical protein WHX53_01985 [Anaerolineae bacterium]